MNTVAKDDGNLKWDVFTSKRPGLSRDLPAGKENLMWVANSSTLLYGERDAVLVDTFLTIDQSQALLNWVIASGKNLIAIYLTHGHGETMSSEWALFWSVSRARRPLQSRRSLRPCVSKFPQRRLRTFGANCSRAKSRNISHSPPLFQVTNWSSKDTTLSRSILEEPIPPVRHACMCLQSDCWLAETPSTTESTRISRRPTPRADSNGSLRSITSKR
jgi:hypothetical protein